MKVWWELLGAYPKQGYLVFLALGPNPDKMGKMKTLEQLGYLYGNHSHCILAIASYRACNK